MDGHTVSVSRESGLTYLPYEKVEIKLITKTNKQTRFANRLRLITTSQAGDHMSQ